MNLFSLLPLDPSESAGVLARAALALETGNSNPAAEPRLAEETSIRNKIYNIAVLENHLSSVEEDPRLISDWITDQLDNIGSPSDAEAALSRLSKAALLSSDEYEIEFTDGFFEEMLYQKGDQEIATAIIKSPDDITDYGENPSDEPSMLMLLGRWIGVSSSSDFYLGLVICQKIESKLKIMHLWKVLPSKVNLNNCVDVFDMYKRFCIYYGYGIELFGKKGKFVSHMVVKRDKQQNILDYLMKNFRVNNIGGKSFINTAVIIATEEEILISFATALNVNHYVKDLRRNGLA